MVNIVPSLPMMHLNTQSMPSTPDRRRDARKDAQRQPTGGEELDLQNLSISQPETSSTFNNEVDTWQGKVHVPDRFFRQVRSSSGKLAYVIFGIEESSGVYYNWQAANHYLSSFRPNQKPDNRGYSSYLEADQAWAFFKQTGVVPLGPSSGVTASLLVDHALSSPSRLQASPAHHAPSSPVHHAPRVGHQAPTPARFYIVHVGYSPGVYTSLRLAQNAVNASDSHPIMEAATRSEANQNFVDAFMTGRVICIVDDE